MTVIAIGSYFAFTSLHLLLGSEAAFLRVVVGGVGGMLFAVAGGYLMSVEITKQIVAGVLEAVSPALNLLPGGRRRTDPPADA